MHIAPDSHCNGGLCQSQRLLKGNSDYPFQSLQVQTAPSQWQWRKLSGVFDSSVPFLGYVKSPKVELKILRLGSSRLQYSGALNMLGQKTEALAQC